MYFFFFCFTVPSLVLTGFCAAWSLYDDGFPPPSFTFSFSLIDTEGRDSLFLLSLVFAVNPSLYPLFPFSYTPVSRCSLDSGCTTSIILHKVVVVVVVVVNYSGKSSLLIYEEPRLSMSFIVKGCRRILGTYCWVTMYLTRGGLATDLPVLFLL